MCKYAEAGVGVGFQVVCCFLSFFVHFITLYACVPWHPPDLEYDVWELILDLVGECMYLLEDVFSCQLGPCIVVHDGGMAVNTHGDLDPIEVATGALQQLEL